MTTFVENLALWWLTAGFLILILEMVSGSLFFLWMSAAMFLTGAATWAFGLPPNGPMLLFALASVASVYGWRRYRPLKAMEQRDVADGINNRMAGFIGRELLLEEPMQAGMGRVRLDDSFWRAEGPALDLPAGTRVRVVAVDGLTVKVEPVR
ncbi:MAG: NfeD family protein [Moraxellaceae bacterium]